jgi:hypothetical protein
VCATGSEEPDEVRLRLRLRLRLGLLVQGFGPGVQVKSCCAGWLDGT